MTKANIRQKVMRNTMETNFIRDGNKKIPITDGWEKPREKTQERHNRILTRFLELRKQNPNIPKFCLLRYLSKEFSLHQWSLYRIIHNYGY